MSGNLKKVAGVLGIYVPVIAGIILEEKSRNRFKEYIAGEFTELKTMVKEEIRNAAKGKELKD